MKRTLAIVMVALFAAPATAGDGLTNIEPFSGQYSDGFEAVDWGEYFSLDVFSGMGTTTPIGAEQQGGGAPTLSVVFGVFLGVSLDAFSGLKTMGTVFEDGDSAPVRWTFHTPAHRFGGFFGTVDTGSPGATAFFFDESNDLIGIEDVTVPIGGWAWNGWESDTGIARIDVLGNGNFGPGFIFYDQMEYDPIPAPASLAPLAGLLLYRRRCRRD